MAATEIASSATLGDPTVPNPKSSRSFPADITGTTPARATFATASRIGSVDGSPIAPPPEKLSTSMPSSTADSNASMISAAFAT